MLTVALLSAEFTCVLPLASALLQGMRHADRGGGGEFVALIVFD